MASIIEVRDVSQGQSQSNTPTKRLPPLRERPLINYGLPPSSGQPPSSPSSESSRPSVSQFYGVGDPEGQRDLITELPASILQDTRPLANDYPSMEPTLYLTRHFPKGTTKTQRTTLPRLSPEHNPSPPNEQSQQPSHPTTEQFSSALQLIRQVVGTNQQLTTALLRQQEYVRQWQQTWGPQVNPPPYSPPRPSSTRSEASFRTAASYHTPSNRSSSPPITEIPNPPIPGDPEQTYDALFDRVNNFARANGFGIVKRNRHKARGRIIRYTFQCDRFGEPRPAQGAGIRQPLKPLRTLHIAGLPR
ncbi:hypothetical protein CMEL01_03407 [Colletotrichum melonis]|uniref:FAR1 domain-containing protein n=1 Tax=Colletotrichum melonis TaxID=1209925 RepID=A0AAI9UKY5_9PEZI|nr:hypothetical protein CMEL01_03407 [Colletotrichum melonis]